MAPEVTIQPWDKRRHRSAIERWPAPQLPEHWLRVIPVLGGRQSWAIELAGELAGRISLRGMTDGFFSATMGIYLRPDLYGQGIGSAAIRAFVPIAPVTFVTADVALDNERARRCYDKAGFLELYVRFGYAVLGRWTRATSH